MEDLTKTQLAYFKSIIKQIVDSDKVAKIELEKAKELKKLENDKKKYEESKNNFKVTLSNVIETIKENIFDAFDDENSYDLGYYDTSTYIKEKGDITDLKKQLENMILEFSTDLIKKSN